MSGFSLRATQGRDLPGRPLLCRGLQLWSHPGGPALSAAQLTRLVPSQLRVSHCERVWMTMGSDTWPQRKTGGREVARFAGLVAHSASCMLTCSIYAWRPSCGQWATGQSTSPHRVRCRWLRYRGLLSARASAQLAGTVRRSMMAHAHRAGTLPSPAESRVQLGPALARHLTSIPQPSQRRCTASRARRRTMVTCAAKRLIALE